LPQEKPIDVFRYRVVLRLSNGDNRGSRKLDDADYRLIKPSDRDREIIQIISETILQSIGEISGKNDGHPKDIYISDEDAAELLMLLEKLLNDPTFQRKVGFVEAIAGRNGLLKQKLARVYFANSRGLGKSGTAGNIENEWRNFVNGYATLSFDKFISQERDILCATGFHPVVANLLLNMIFDTRDRIERHPESRKGSIVKAVDKTVNALRDRIVSPTFGKTIKLVNLSSVGIIVSDSAALFTTKDLNIAGTLSTLSGAALSLKKEGRR
jgi:hypothetical protein